MSASAPSPRPTALEVLPQHIPATMRRRDHWVTWRYEWRSPAWTKVPYRADGRGRASATAPGTWSTLDAALAAYQAGGFDGVGIILRERLIGVDHDRAIDPLTGALSEQAQSWERLGAYREASPSGTGVHDLVMGVLPDDQDRQGSGRRRGTLEVYAGDRFLTVTGHRRAGSATDVPLVNGELTELYREWLPPASRPNQPGAPSPLLSLDDAAIVQRARSAANGHKFDQLWSGSTSAHGEDSSAADLALLSLLAFYTQDEAQLNRLFRQSGLMREKWERADYRSRTIARALNRSEFYGPPARIITRIGPETTVSDAGADSSAPVSPAKAGKPSQASQVVELVLGSDTQLWHTPEGDPWVTVRVREHREHHSLTSKPFKDHVSWSYWGQHGRNVGNQALLDGLNTLAGQARFESNEHQVAGRIVHHDGAVWIDLGDAEWRAVRIDAEGYRLVESIEIPVKFRRGRSVQPLPVPVDGGSLDELRSLFRFDDDNWQLTEGCLLGMFQPDGARAHLEIIGRQGSGKSTFARFFVALVDPSEMPVRSLPKDEEALAIGLQGRAVMVFDNVSSLTPELSDAFCRVSTGGGISRRELYTNSEEITLKVRLSLLWTGITPVTIDRPDLADRTVSIAMEPIEEADRRSERDLAAAFDEMRPRLFGALCRAVSVALARRDTLEMDNLPRLADFALWVEAAAPELGWEPGAFCEALGASRSNANALAVEGSPIGPLIVQFANQQRSWRGSASELLTALRELADDETRRLRRFPKQANHLSNYLRRLQPALTSQGIYIGFDRSRTGSQILIDVREQLGLSLPPLTGSTHDDDRMVF